MGRQIPVCFMHHQQIHRGKYDGVPLKSLPGYEHAELAI